MDAFSWWQKPDGQLTYMLVVDGDKIDDAVLLEVECMAQNAGLDESSLAEIFVPSCGHTIEIIDDSVQFACVGRGPLKGYSAAGSGGSQGIRERAAVLGILLIGLVMGVSLGAPTLREHVLHLTDFMQAPKPFQSGGASSSPRGTASYTTSSSGGGFTHRLREPGTIAPSSSTGPAVVGTSTISSSSTCWPRSWEQVRQPGHQAKRWEPYSTRQFLHSNGLRLLRVTKKMLTREVAKNLFLMASIEEGEYTHI
jgi:hypothetical protein